MYPTEFEEVISAFQKLPGVGAKTAERYAFTLLNMNENERDQLIKDLQKSKKVKRCKTCGNITSSEICEICSDPQRNHSVICIVETPKDLAVLEKLGEYNGLYHVLNGLINTQKGILPDQLNIDSIISRLDGVEEVIIALNPTIEGETTGLYLTRLLKGLVPVSRLATGIPIGSSLDYLDNLTLKRAFDGRTSQT